MPATKKAKKAEVIEPSTGLVPTPVASPKAVMVTPGQLRKQTTRDKEIREVINDYIKNNMVSGKDYGTIKITTKSGGEVESKPSLFKPGAEKFCGLFKIRPTFRKDIETVEMLGSTAGIIAYICELVDGRGQVIGEGRGSSSVSPGAPDFDVNKAIKIAEKRAQIDAVLRTGGLSDFFTQDMEDAPKEVSSQVSQPATNGGHGQTTTSTAPASKAQTDLITKLVPERFTDDKEFTDFANKLVGKEDEWDKSQASKLISAILQRPKLDGGDDDNDYAQ